MDCPFCHTKNITGNRCTVCKAIIPMPVKEEENTEKETVFKKIKKERK